MAKKIIKQKASNSKKPKRSVKRRLFLIFLATTGAGFLFLFLLFGAVYVGLFGKLPEDDELKNITQYNATEVYSSDGVLLGKYFIQNRSSISYKDIPEVMINALVATEDSRFFEHEGIDFYSIPRVVVKTIILGDKSSGGGSTISQQLAKNLYGRDDYGALSMPVNKLKENIIALKLEDLYSKEEVITLYLNTVSFGENVFGIKSAAYRFFGKMPSVLSVPEAATLIGMLKANTGYNPRLYPEASFERRNTVMALMVREGSMEPDELIRLQAEPLTLNYRRDDGHRAPAPYLRAYLEPTLNSILSNTSKPDGKPYSLYTDGVKVTLTVNSSLQANAEKAMKEHLSKLQSDFDKHWQKSKPWSKKPDFLWDEAKKSLRYKNLKAQGKTEKQISEVFNTKTKILRYIPEGSETAEMTPLDSIAWHQMVLQAGFLAMDVNTGKILAYVGGADFGYFPYDHVHGRRQAGSTFKPFVYATALEAGMSPCDFIANEKIIFSNYSEWSPENSNKTYGGYYTLQGGLANSVNTIAANLMSQAGPGAVAEMAKRLGVSSPLPKVPSLALGVADVTLLEMVQGYAAFANGGKRIEPVYIEKVESADGKVLYKSKVKTPKQVLDPYMAHSMRHMLEMVVDSGTARSLRGRYGVRGAMGGKTGTTQNNADGWFMGITPNVAMGAWVGGQSPLVRFRNTSLGQGAATAMPIVANFVKHAESDAASRKILGRAFTPAVPYEPCEMYVDELRNGFFDNLFDSDARDERSENREEERKEKQAFKEKSSEELERDDRWMKRLMDKLKKKKEQDGTGN